MDTRWAAQKYGPRSLLYGALEAGSAIQLLVDAARREGISSHQVGGYLEPKLLDLVSAAPSEILLSVALLGYAADA